MRIIIDSGSTKCDWGVLDRKNDLILQTQTIGFNPNLISSSFFSENVKKNKKLDVIYPHRCSIYFYGAGCGQDKNKIIIKKTFQNLFPHLENIEIHNDLYGASLASFTGTPSIVCILGTGSNSCFFDGKNTLKKTPSLGFLLGDEGSGYALGRSLVQKYFLNQLPDDLHRDFEKCYSLNLNILLENLYHQPRANAYLAKFNSFIAERKEHPFLKNLINKEFEYFFENQVLPYTQLDYNTIHFIGSIALIYKHFVISIAQKYKLKIGNFIQKPIEGLIKYHQNYSC